jgi:hypothetical protein
MYQRYSTLNRDISQVINKSPKDLDHKYHLDSVKGSYTVTNRQYEDIFGVKVDTHSELEKLGACQYCEKYTVIISLEDSLDYILQRLTGCSLDSVRSISSYKVLSRSLLKLNYESLEDLDLGYLLNLDPKLDEYFNLIYSSVESEDPYSAFLEKFVGDLLRECDRILNLISIEFYHKCREVTDSVKLRSKSTCSYILTSSEKLEEEIIIRSSQVEDYTIKVKYFDLMEYSERYNESYIV